jgi:DNA recombination protein RmuC
VKQLASKDYWKHVPESADFVILFIPGENFLAAAAERDPALIEDAFANKVIIATPSILIALAKAVAYGWRQEQSTKNAQEIAKLGRDLHERLKVFADKAANLGASIEKSVKSYNEVVGSLEGRVLPQARRFRDLGAVETDEDISSLQPIDLSVRLPAPPAELDLTPPPVIAAKRKTAPN